MKCALLTLIVLVMSVGVSAELFSPTCKGVVRGQAVTQDGQPVPGIRLMINPLGVDLSYVLPTTRTGEAGEYRFDGVCDGRFTVFVDDEKAGYPMSLWSEIIGNWHEVRITPENLQHELRVQVPPKAGRVQVVARNHKTNTPMTRFTLAVKLGYHDWVRINSSTRDDFLLPSNTNLLCRVVADGYRELGKASKKRRAIKLSPGEYLTLEAEFEPLH